MILMSPSPEIDQDTPVTTTYAPDSRSHLRAQRGPASRPRSTPAVLDWDRVETLYAFARDRAVERTTAAEQRHDSETVGLERLGLHVLDTLYAQARGQDAVLVGCAVTYFRARALRDAHHPDFRGGWIAAAS